MASRQGRIRSLCSFIAVCSLFFVQNVFAWQHEISGGFGYGKELGRSYTNMGFIANYAFLNKSIDPKLHFLMDTSAAYWRADTSENQNLFTYAVSVAFRAYFVNPMLYHYRPFIQVAVGPAFISSKTFGTKTQGMKFIFQDRVGAGIEIGPQHKAIMLSLQFIHYSNADLKKPNPGFNIPFVASVGYEI